MLAAHLTNLFNAIFNCFMIIIFGYAAGRLNIITPAQSHGIGNFVGTFALPGMLFKNMVQLNFATVNWSLMLAVLLAKSAVFVIVLIVGLLVMRKKGIGRSALYAIFATQSNDFALGYPIIAVLYKSTYPEFLQYIYLVAPISLLVLNPIGFVLLEIDKYWKTKNERREETPSVCDDCPMNGQCGSPVSPPPPKSRFSSLRGVLKVAKGLLLNPIVVMVFVGLVFHFIFNGKLPVLLNEILTTLSNAFSATALFYLGISMVGKLSNVKGVALLIPVSLIAAKILLLPILARESVFLFNEFIPVTNPHVNHTSSIMPSITNTSYLQSLANFGFLYGTIPTAPTVVIYAAKYGLEVDRLASGMVICTTLSAPIMYVSAWTLTITSMKLEYYKEQVVVVDQDVSVVGSLCALWCVCVFLITKKFQRVPHLITLVLTLTMFLGSLMTVITGLVDGNSLPIPSMHVVFCFLYFGVTSTRLLTASLAICVMMVKRFGEATAWSYRLYLIFVPTLVSAILTAIVVVTSKTSPDIAPVFQQGWKEDLTSFVCLMVSLLVTCVFLVLIFRMPNIFERPRPSSEMAASLLGSEDPDEETSTESSQPLMSNGELIESESHSEQVTESEDLRWWQRHNGDPQITRHIILLLLLCISLFIGIMLTGWRVSGHLVSGIYFEISFLDSVFNFGQAFFVFIIFGLDSDLILDPVIRAWRKLVKGNEELSQTPLEDVDKEILHKCFVFVKHHLKHCKRDLYRNCRRGLRTYKSVVRGSDLCTWLVEVGLASDRPEALLYGKDLMLGRVLRHVANKHYFYDKPYLYRFEDYERNRRRTHEVDLVPGTSLGSETSSDSDFTASCPRRDFKFSFVRFLSDADLRSTTVASPARRRGRVTHHPLSLSNGSVTGNDQFLMQDETSLSEDPDEGAVVVAKSSREDSANLNDW